MPLTAAEALRGAAYRVIFEQTDPNGCISAEHFEAACRRVHDIETWAAAQQPEIGAAYLLAAQEIRQRARNVYENNQRHRQLCDAYEALPKP